MSSVLSIDREPAGRMLQGGGPRGAGMGDSGREQQATVHSFISRWAPRVFSDVLCTSPRRRCGEQSPPNSSDDQSLSLTEKQGSQGKLCGDCSRGPV